MGILSKVVLGMTISADGFINDRTGSVDALYPDIPELRDTRPLQESMDNTGALIMGRNSFDMVDSPESIADSYEYQVPIFVMTHAPPQKKPKENERLTFTLVTDGIESAVAQARAAAGVQDVTIIGTASTARQCLQAGLADELHVDIMPVLLGGGLKLFEDSGLPPLQLETLQVMALPGGRVHLEFRVVK
jgi:dihydrofolate reductase